jgi:hypothetical protein
MAIPKFCASKTVLKTEYAKYHFEFIVGILQEESSFQRRALHFKPRVSALHPRYSLRGSILETYRLYFSI